MRLLALVLLPALLACATNKAVSAGKTLRPESADECRQHCATLGMQLSAVVVILDSTGCVCEPAGRASCVEGGGSAAAGGAAVQALLAAAQRQDEQHRNMGPPAAATAAGAPTHH